MPRMRCSILIFLSMVVFLDGLLNKEHSATNRKSKLKKKHPGMQYWDEPNIACRDAPTCIIA